MKRDCRGAWSLSGVVLLWGILGLRAAPGQEAVPVSVMAVVRTNMERSLELTGSVRGWQEVNVAAKVPGRVEEILVEMGDAVRAGDVLVRLDDRTARAERDRAMAAVKVAEAALQQAQAQLKLAEGEKRRVENLVAEKSATQRDYDRVVAEYEVARAAVGLAEARLEEARRALEAAEVNLQEHAVVAPFDGKVAQRFVDVGSLVAAGTPLVRLVDTSRLRVLCDVPQVEAAAVQVGQEALLTSDMLPGRKFTGRVGIVGPAVDAVSRTLPIEILVEVPRAAGQEQFLRPGMFVAASIILGREEVLAVRREAVLEIGGTGQPYVYVVKDGRAEKRFIRTGQVSGELVEVVSGLVEGEEVVYRGQTVLRGGEMLKVSDIPGSDEGVVE